VKGEFCIFCYPLVNEKWAWCIVWSINCFVIYSSLSAARRQGWTKIKTGKFSVLNSICILCTYDIHWEKLRSNKSEFFFVKNSLIAIIGKMSFLRENEFSRAGTGLNWNADFYFLCMCVGFFTCTARPHFTLFLHCYIIRHSRFFFLECVVANLIEIHWADKFVNWYSCIYAVRR